MADTSLPIRVLVVEDNPDYALLVHDLLRASDQQLVVAHTEDLGAALDRVSRDTFDVVLLDLNLPDSSGVATLQRLAAHAPLLPIVILSGVDNDETTAKSLREGAQDFLLKAEIDSRLLYRSIRYAIDRHASEAKLVESESRYRSLIEGSAQGILIHSNGVVQLANAALVALVGWHSSDDVVGRSIWPFITPEDRARVEQMMRGRAQGEPVPDHYEFRIVRTDGKIVWVECAATAITWDGAPALMATLFNVTDRNRTEEELRQAQKMEAIGRLAGGIAHDFNNLLVVIGGNSELLLEDLGESHPAATGLRQIDAASKSAAHLTRQLLAFSRRQMLQPQIIDINDVVRSLESMLSRVLGEGIEMVMTLDPEVHRVIADPGRMEQVVMNLAVNARDAMPDGGSLVIRTANVELETLFVATHPGARRGEYVMLAVIDSGGGMDEATQKRLFEPFFTTKAAGKGTGLGLATVYGIVKQSDGFIFTRSEIGKGSTFTVFLPRTKIAAAEMVDAGPPARLQGHETILVVEDQPSVLAVTREALQRFGYSVIAAASADEALDAVTRFAGTIHLLLTDVVLTGMNGRDLARRVYALHGDTRVLYMSGYTDDVIVHHGVLERGLAFLEKPFTPTFLAQRVREVLDAPLAPAI